MAFTVRTKIVLITVLILFLAMGLNTLVSSTLFTREYTQALQSGALIVGRSLKLQLDRLLALGIKLDEIVGFEEQSQDTVNKYQGISYAMVVDMEGTILFHNDPSLHGQLLTNAKALQALQTNTEGVELYLEAGKQHYNVTIPVFEPTNEMQIGAVRVGFPADLITLQIQRMWKYSIGVAAISLATAALSLIFVISIWVARPLTKLLLVIQEIRREGTPGLTRRVEVKSRDEIGLLGYAFNQMMDELQTRTQELTLANNQLQSEIAERKRAEDALKEYSERLEEMVDERTRELQLAQEQLIRQEKLAFLGQLAGGVGHELRNPLGVINNAVFFLQNVLAEADQQVKEYLDLIGDRVQEAEKIVSDLLNLSRNRTAERMEVEAAQVLEEVLARHPAPEAVHVIIDLPSTLPLLFVDPQQTRQVLANLVVNAYQAMPEGGNLTISALATCDHIQVNIADSGQGMSSATMKMIFEPLYTTKTNGIGLGLAVSKNLVELNGGQIDVHSEEGQGSTFRITFPIQ